MTLASIKSPEILIDFLQIGLKSPCSQLAVTTIMAIDFSLINTLSKTVATMPTRRVKLLATRLAELPTGYDSTRTAIPRSALKECEKWETLSDEELNRVKKLFASAINATVAGERFPDALPTIQMTPDVRRALFAMSVKHLREWLEYVANPSPAFLTRLENERIQPFRRAFPAGITDLDFQRRIQFADQLTAYTDGVWAISSKNIARHYAHITAKHAAVVAWLQLKALAREGRRTYNLNDLEVKSQLPSTSPPLQITDSQIIAGTNGIAGEVKLPLP